MTNFMGYTGRDATRVKAEFEQELSMLSLAKIGRLVGEKSENIVVHSFYDLPNLRTGTFSKNIYNGYKLDTSASTVSLLRQIKEIAENPAMPIVAVAFKTIKDDFNDVPVCLSNGGASEFFTNNPKYSANGLRVVSRAVCYIGFYLKPGNRMLADHNGWLNCGARMDSQSASGQFPLRIYPTVYTPDYPLTDAMIEDLLQDRLTNLILNTNYNFIQRLGNKSRIKHDYWIEANTLLISHFYDEKIRMERAPEFSGHKLVAFAFKRVDTAPGVGKFCQNPRASSSGHVFVANLITQNKDGKFETHPRGWTQTGEYAIDPLWPENGIGYQKTDWIQTMLNGYRGR